MAAPGVNRHIPLHEKVIACYDFLVSLDLSVMDFVYSLFWGDEECRQNARLQRARQTFNGDARFTQLLRNMHRPPRTGSGADGKQPAGARAHLEDFAFSCIVRIFKRELEAYEKTTTIETGDIDLAALKSITLAGIFDDINAHAPRLWATLQELMQTADQLRRNTRKTPETMSAIIINMMSFSRSQQQGKIQNLLSMFWKAEGLPVRVFDILNAFGLSMSRGWTDRMTKQLAEKSMEEAREAVLSSAVSIPSDNLRLESHVDSERLHNQSQGVNCTGMSVVELPFRFKGILDNYQAHAATRERHTDGSPKIIGWADLMNLDGLRTIHKFSVYLVQSVLFALPELAGLPLRSHDLLKRPDPVSGLPVQRTRSWALRTVPIDQGSYEGNGLVLEEILRQLHLDTEEQQLRLATSAGLPFPGNLLTGQLQNGLRGLRSEDDNGFDRLDWVLPVHGFFHNRMNFQYAILDNHRGNSAGDGLAREINALDRRGLPATAKQPNLHTLDEFLLHFWTASTLENWMSVTETNSIDDLVTWARSITDPATLLSLSNRIVRDLQSAVGITKLNEKVKAAELAARATQSTTAHRGTNTEASSFEDQRLAARIICNRDLNLLQVERFAIKHGDVVLFILDQPPGFQR